MKTLIDWDENEPLCKDVNVFCPFENACVVLLRRFQLWLFQLREEECVEDISVLFPIRVSL